MLIAWRPVATAVASGALGLTLGVAHAPLSATAHDPECGEVRHVAAHNVDSVRTDERLERRERQVVIPAGTRLSLRLSQPVASDTSSVEDRVRATLRSPLVVNGRAIVPAGTPVLGSVTAARRSGRVKGRAYLAMRFHTLSLDDDRYRIATTRYGQEAPGTKRKDAAKIAIPAAGGAVVGGIAGGKKGAVIGTGAGAGGGTAYVLATRGKEVRLARGSVVTVRLERPLIVNLPAR